jgi:excisionase family DNA binding protein
MASRERLSLYTAQDVARFCEVDLKTIHHWAGAGKISHHRTEGRHLRFRRNDVVRFLRAHGYPLHDALTSVRPVVFFAMPADDMVKKLAQRFEVRAFPNAISALVHLLEGEPDALVLSASDPTWAPAPTIAALRASPPTAWPLFVLADGDATSGADVVVSDRSRLPAELARALAVS